MKSTAKLKSEMDKTKKKNKENKATEDTKHTLKCVNTV